MEPAGFFIFATLFVLVGAPIFYAGVRKRRRVSKLLRDGPVDLRQLRARSSDPVWINGTATPHDETTTSALTDSACLAYEYRIEEREAETISSWTPIEQKQDHVRFVLDDGTGSILVDPEHADLDVDAETVLLRTDPTTLPAAIEEYVEDSDRITAAREAESFFSIKYEYRFREWRIEPGEEVHIYGAVERAPTEALGDGHVDATITGERGPFLISNSRQLLGSPAIGGGGMTAMIGGWMVLFLGIVLLGCGFLLLLGYPIPGIGR